MTATYIGAFGASLLAALAVTPMARRLALRLGAVDLPTQRKAHADPIPYLGGLAIILAFAAAVVASAYFWDLAISYWQAIAIMGGALFLAAMGLWDDVRVVPGWMKVPLEIALGIGLYASGVQVQLFNIVALDLILTLAWVVGITNAINYMDNMDGLTAGVSAIVSIYFFVLAAASGQFLVASMAVALAGCALGFLWHNRPPARIFMGDAGSLFLGYLLAVLGLKLRFENIVRVTFFVPIAVLALPTLDALMVSVSRVRRGLSPIHPGQDHISHRLVRVGIHPKAAVGLLYFVAAACGWIGAVIAYAEPATAYMLMGWLVVVGVFLGWLLLKVEVD